MSEVLAFPLWLKLRRRGLGWTQEQLAKRCFCAVITVKRIESGDLAPSEQLAEAIGRELKIPDARMPEFVQFARRPDLDLPSNHFEVDSARADTISAAVKHRMPSTVNSFVGRATELTDVRALLVSPEVRLVTLVGPAGSGKTRLALQAGLRLQDEFVSGACFVPLSNCRAEDDVLNAIARALQVKPETGVTLIESVTASLQSQTLLLVLDNFEHVLAAAPIVAHILRVAQNVSLLVTSREALRIVGEHEYPVAPFATPEPDADLILTSQNEAVRLFAERVRAVKPEFALHHGNVQQVAELCRLLDGVPLAIEMAAARAKYAALPALTENLRTNLTTLGTSLRDADTRHRTLSDAIAWSVNLLPADLRALYCALGVLEGGSTAETAAQLMLPASPADFDAGQLFALCEANLLRAHALPDGTHRFVQLGIFREDARTRLRSAQQLDVITERAARIFGALARTTQAALYGPNQPQLLDMLDAEHANIYAASRWALTHDVPLALQIAAVMTDARYVRGRWAESYSALAAAVSAARATPDAPELRTALAHALRNYGFMAHVLGDSQQALTHNEEALALSAQLDDNVALAAVHRNLGMVHRERVALDEALRHFRASLEIYESLGNEPQIAWLKELIGQVYMSFGQSNRARDMLTEALALRRKAGGQRGIAETLLWLGRCEYFDGDYLRGETHIQESAQLATQMHDTQGLAMALCGQAAVALKLGRAEEALGAVERALPMMRELRFRKGLAWALHEHGDALLALGRVQASIEALREGAQLSHAIKDLYRTVACLDVLAEALLGVSPERAAVIFGAALQHRALAQTNVLASERDRHARLSEALTGYEASIIEGRAMQITQVLAA